MCSTCLFPVQNNQARKRQVVWSRIKSKRSKMTLILRCSPRPKITDDRKINTNYTPIILDATVCNTSSSFLIQQVTPLTERLSRWSPSPPQHIKTTFQDPINAHRSISPVQFLPHLPLSSACSHTGILNLAKWHMKKVKTERLNVKMGHSTLAAYLMHVSLLSTRWRHFWHNCLQLKVNTHKKRKLPKLL